MNRLGQATSPYLLQHADNPVDWWEWGPEPFAEARRRNVPVLLSIGYAACHWCHVMAHESFEDADTAAYLNERFVSIKVDREERPDVDAVYMQATVAMTGQGGWPMTCVLDHDQNPFFAGTYFPDTPRHGMPSFRQLLQAISEVWTGRPEEVAAAARRARELLNQAASAGGDPVDAALLDGVVAELERSYDDRHGGFGTAPKFPPSMLLELLLRHTRRTGSVSARRMLDETLAAMARGGMYDQLGGGFARYSVDPGWVVPHFEKMLYDNAQLLSVYAGRAGLLPDHPDPLAERVVRETVGWLTGPMRAEGGAFHASMDADSDGAEGTYYVWTPGQLREVLGDDAERAAALLSVTERGTFEHGASTLQLRTDPDDPAWWAGVRTRLAAARDRRTLPAVDDKIVAAWNGQAIAGLVRAGLVLDEPGWVAAAAEAASYLWEVHVVDGRLRRVSRQGAVGAPAGVLEDHACLADGFLWLVEATAEQTWLERAGRLLDVALTHFAADDGGFFDTADDAEALVARPRDPSDNASPSGTSAMIHALLRYAALTGSGRHRDAAERALASVAALVAKAPRFAGWSAAAAEALVAGPREIVVVTTADDPEGLAMARIARADPGSVALVLAPDQASGVPLAEGRTQVEGRATAYVCRGLVCDRPVTSADELAALLH